MKEQIKFVEDNSQKGVTLVTLVVTIIILLILASVTITATIGDRSIIKKSQETKNKLKEEVQGNQEEVDNLLNQLKNDFDDDPIIEETPKLEKGEIVDESTRYEMYKDDTGSVPIPGGYCVVNDITKTDGTKDENKVSTGLVISDVAGDDLNNSKGGNQFVWVPVSNVSTMFGISSNDTTNARKFGKIYDFSSTSGITPLNWEETNGVMRIISKTDNREPDIITGTDGAQYDKVSSYYTNAGIKDKAGNAITTSAQFETLLKKEFDDMIASVNRYKGFYIGRYETGNLVANKTSIPVSKKGRSDISNVNWYYMYANSKKIAKNSNVTSNMIWGCQYDAVLTWMFNSTDSKVKKFVTDSTGKGNYSGGKKSTGSSETYSINHIYDMARKYRRMDN